MGVTDEVGLPEAVESGQAPEVGTAELELDDLGDDYGDDGGAASDAGSPDEHPKPRLGGREEGGRDTGASDVSGQPSPGPEEPPWESERGTDEIELPEGSLESESGPPSAPRRP